MSFEMEKAKRNLWFSMCHQILNLQIEKNPAHGRVG